MLSFEVAMWGLVGLTVLLFCFRIIELLTEKHDYIWRRGQLVTLLVMAFFWFEFLPLLFYVEIPWKLPDYISFLFVSVFMSVLVYGSVLFFIYLVIQIHSLMAVSFMKNIKSK